jgi:hypothetical protein
MIPMAATTAGRQPLTPQSEFAGILKDQETFGTGRGENAADQINSWFDELMLQSGLGIGPSIMVGVCMCSALALGGRNLRVSGKPADDRPGRTRRIHAARRRGDDRADAKAG